MNAPRIFGIRESTTYQQQFAQLVNSAQLRDDIQRACDLDVAKNPYEFEEIPDTPYRAVGIVCFPPLTIYFSIHESEHIIELEEIHPL